MTLVLTPWQAPPSQPELTTGTVHLWRFPLVCNDSLEHLLNADERQRARRYLIPDKARDFVVARARLRLILANYLELAPQSVRFTSGHAGKPALAGPLAEPLAFNLSHSGGWGLCAVTRGVAVGVDIERLDRKVDYDKLAARFFSANEQKFLQAGSARRRRRLFFRIWTRKEAWLKGKGGGFSDPDQDIGPAHLAGCDTHDGNWWLRSFPVGHNYLATLALSQECSLLRRWNGWNAPG
jgi:4'-phosphopantetheinyl transferase